MRAFNRLAAALCLVLAGCGLVETKPSDAYETQLAAQCAAVSTAASSSLALKDAYIGGNILWMFAAEMRETDSWRFPSVNSVLNFFLKSGLASLETDNAWPVQFKIPPSEKPILKLFIAPMGHPSCKGYPDQFKYRMQVVPGLRRSGVGENQCIAVEYLSASTASVRFEFSSEPTVNQYGRQTHQSSVTINDYTTGNQPRLISQVDVLFSRFTGFGKYGQELYSVDCHTSRQNIKDLVASIRGIGNPAVTTTSTVDLPLDDGLLLPNIGTDAEKRHFVDWTKDAVSVSEGSMDKFGVIWLGDAYQRGPTNAITKSGLTLYYYKDQTIISKPLSLPESWAWASGYKIERLGKQIHLALVSRRGSPEQAHLWLVLDEKLAVNKAVMFEGDLWPRKN